MKTVKTLCELNAPVEKVWQILSNIKRWPQWNTVITDIAAEPEYGGKMEFRILLDGRKRPMKFNATFSQWEQNHSIAWKGGINGLFTGEHYLHLKEIDDKHTHVIHGEEFGGLIPALFMRKGLLGRIEKTYNHFNRQLRDVVRKGVIDLE